MIDRFGREKPQVAAVQIHAIEAFQIGISPGLPPGAQEIDDAFLLVDVDDVGDDPGSRRDLVQQCASGNVVMIEMAPAVALREPQKLTPLVDELERDAVPDAVVTTVQADEGRAGFLQDKPRLAGGGVDAEQPDPPIMAIARQHVDGLRIRRPFGQDRTKSADRIDHHVGGDIPNVDALAARCIEDHVGRNREMGIARLRLPEDSHLGAARPIRRALPQDPFARPSSRRSGGSETWSNWATRTGTAARPPGLFSDTT